EYEQLAVADALSRGENVYNVAFSIDAHCPMRGAAMQLIRNVLEECGRILAIAPDHVTLAANLDVVEAAVASTHPQEWVEKKCRIPAVISEILVVRATASGAGEEMLDTPKPVTTPADDDELNVIAEEKAAPPANVPV